MLGVTQPVSNRAETETQALCVQSALVSLLLAVEMSKQEPKREEVCFGSLFRLQDTQCRNHCDKIWGSKMSISTVKTQKKKMHALLAYPTLHRSGCPPQGTVSPIIKRFLPISINVCPEAYLQGESRLCHSTVHLPRMSHLLLFIHSLKRYLSVKQMFTA